eukprot:m.359825 g.359825  ORF g.359825 m.359825 type:complete len:93 (+) comp20764_c0_seq1:950-1228(+)
MAVCTTARTSLPRNRGVTAWLCRRMQKSLSHNYFNNLFVVPFCFTVKKDGSTQFKRFMHAYSTSHIVNDVTRRLFVAATHGDTSHTNTSVVR